MDRDAAQTFRGPNILGPNIQNVRTGKHFSHVPRMFVRVGPQDGCLYGCALCRFFQPSGTTQKVWTAEKGLPVQTFRMFGRRPLCGSCGNVCTGRPFAVFGHFSKGVQGRKKASRPEHPLGLTREAFCPKRLTRTNIQNPMFVLRGLFGPQSGAVQTSGGGKQRAAPPRRATKMARKLWFRRLDVWAAPDGLTRKG